MSAVTDVIDLYVAAGRARNETKRELARLEEKRQEEENKRQLAALWADVRERVERTIPAELLPYVVEPTERPEEFWSNRIDYRPLVLDLSSFGLGELGAWPNSREEEGISWKAPSAVIDEDSGRWVLWLTPWLQGREIQGNTVSFAEAMADAADAAKTVAENNAQIDRKAQALEPEPDIPDPYDPYAPLREKAGGYWPVLRAGVGGTRANCDAIHAAGYHAAQEFGQRCGAEGWKDCMTVHTFTLPHAPCGNLYAYLALVPVAPDKWPEVVKGA